MINYRDLVNRLNKYNYEYHVLDLPSISDIEYDNLYKQVIEYEQQNPDKILPYSPSLRVGDKPLDKFEKYEHEFPLLSLENTYNEAEILEFYEKYLIQDDKKMAYTLEYKIDGLSIAIKYEKGIFVSAATRGDGLIGEDISQNVRAIKEIPLKLNEEVDITVRGEVYLSKKDFTKLNLQREKDGEKLFANPRNAAAGTLRQLDSKVVALRNLQIFIFDALSTIDNIDNHPKMLEYLKSLGFKCSIYSEIFTEDDLIQKLREAENKRSQLDFDIDGMVLKLSDLNLRKKLGMRSRSPYWAVAYKFKSQKVITKIINITCQVGRTGVITPRADFEPVFLAGSLISHASLHNADYIKEKDIRIGDIVEIEKAGDVIPQVNRVIFEKRTGNEIEYEFPKFCPVCKGNLVRKEGESAYRCISSSCLAKDIRSLVYFVSKSGMNIDGFGEKIVESLFNNGLLKDFTDIYKLKNYEEEIISIEGFAQKSLDNLLVNIENSKQNPPNILLSSIGIPLIGSKVSKLLFDKYKSFDALINAKSQDLLEIVGIGESIVNSLKEYFDNESNIQMLSELKSLGLSTELIEIENSNEKEKIFYGQSFVITGTLRNYTRREASDIIESLGGLVRSSVSKNTTYLLAGDNAGSKLSKANNLGIKIMSEEEFKRQIDL